MLARKIFNASFDANMRTVQGHQEVYSATHVGSSGAMEVNTAVKLWERSESIGFRYTTVLSDGNYNSFLELKERNVHGNASLDYNSSCDFHILQCLCGVAEDDVSRSSRCTSMDNTFSIADRSREQTGQGINLT
ncbi:hypothetical protein TNCV_2638601 [Trichonephila clavipes]|nr:hypothetical protein TNCV_2638601 [Trichonephila clavipes]